MLPKSFAGISLAVVACAGLAGTVSANTIYQDTFTGTGTLNGSAPNTVNTPNATWTADASWSDSGYNSGVTSGGGILSRVSASLPFTPVAGQIYTLSAGMDVTKMTNPGDTTPSDYWFALGFLSNQATSGGWDGNGQASPWVINGFVSSTPANNQGTVFTGPNLAGGQAFGTDLATGVNNYDIVLNTTSSLWTYQVFLTNSANTNLLVGSGTFTTNPTITAVGIQDGLGAGYVSDFTLTAVPEPATLGLMGIGAAGLLLVGRKRRVA